MHKMTLGCLACFSRKAKFIQLFQLMLSDQSIKL